jgi:hypothetical protein
VTGAKVADYFFVSLSLSHSTTFSSSALSSAASVGDCFSKRRPWLLSRSRIAGHRQVAASGASSRRRAVRPRHSTRPSSPLRSARVDGVGKAELPISDAHLALIRYGSGHIPAFTGSRYPLTMASMFCSSAVLFVNDPVTLKPGGAMSGVVGR